MNVGNLLTVPCRAAVRATWCRTYGNPRPKCSYIQVNQTITLSHTNLLSTRCTLFYLHYTNLLHVGRRSGYMVETCKRFVYKMKKTFCRYLVVNLCVLDCYMEGVQHQINHLATLKAKDQDTDSTYNSNVSTLRIWIFW